jgi:hypothetical protein
MLVRFGDDFLMPLGPHWDRFAVVVRSIWHTTNIKKTMNKTETVGCTRACPKTVGQRLI